jgi:hypothetical protein
MSPEEMQEQAEDSGLFRIEPEFTWLYPWFRLHYKLSVILPQGNPDIDYGWSALPFGESYSANNTAVANLINGATSESDPLAIADLAMGSLVQMTAYLLMGKSVAAVWLAIGLYLGWTVFRTAQAVMMGKGATGWLIGFVMALIGSVVAFALEGVYKAEKFLTSAARWFVDDVSLMARLHGFWLNFFDITTLALAVIDFANMAICATMFLASL